MSTWKNVGMTYLKYADLCATHVRNALKEPMKTKALKGGGYAIIKREWTAGVISKEMTMTPEGIVMAEEK